MNIKEFNREDYNKMCAEFIGCTFTIESMFEEYEDKETIYYEEFSKPFFWDDSFNHRYGFLSYQQAKYMLYDSDWNWIMEVLRMIEAVNQGVPQQLLNVNLYSEKQEVVLAIWEFLN